MSVACVSCHDGVQALNVTLDGPVREIPGRSRGRVTSMVSVFVGGPLTEMAVSHPVGVPYGAWGKRNPYAADVSDDLWNYLFNGKAKAGVEFLGNESQLLG